MISLHLAMYSSHWLLNGYFIILLLTFADVTFDCDIPVTYTEEHQHIYIYFFLLSNFSFLAFTVNSKHDFLQYYYLFMANPVLNNLPVNVVYT